MKELINKKERILEKKQGYLNLTLRPLRKDNKD